MGDDKHVVYDEAISRSADFLEKATKCARTTLGENLKHLAPVGSGVGPEIEVNGELRRLSADAPHCAVAAAVYLDELQDMLTALDKGDAETAAACGMLVGSLQLEVVVNRAGLTMLDVFRASDSEHKRKRYSGAKRKISAKELPRVRETFTTIRHDSKSDHQAVITLIRQMKLDVGPNTVKRALGLIK